MQTIAEEHQLKCIVVWLWETSFGINVADKFKDMDDLFVKNTANGGEVKVVLRGGKDAVEAGKITGSTRTHLFPKCAEQTRFAFQTVDTSVMLEYPMYSGHRPVEGRH